MFSFYALLHDDGLPSMDGRLPLEKRVSIEAFQRDVEPHILSAREALLGDSRELHAYSESSEIQGVSHGSWMLQSQILGGRRVSASRVREIASSYLESIGYVLVLDDSHEGGSDTFVWRDLDNGGAVDVSSRDQITSFRYESGERPSDGSVPDPTVLIPNDHRDLPDPLA